MLPSNTIMKTIILPALALLLTVSVVAQEAPPPPAIQILPAEVPPGEPMPFDPDEFGMEEGFIPGHGEMFMPDMPGRYQMVSAQIQQNGKAMPIVLKLDTQTGQVWQLKFVSETIIAQGRRQMVNRLTFVPVDDAHHTQPLPPAVPDEPGFGPDGGESIEGGELRESAPPEVQALPNELPVRRVTPAQPEPQE